MKILLIMDPGIPVPPQLYGGHERLVHLFAEEYQRLGHQVTLLAGPDSHCSGTTITFGRNSLGRSLVQKLKELFFVWKYLYKHQADFDIIHNFGRLLYLAVILNSPVKKIMTYGRKITPGGIRIFNSLPNKNLVFTACSNNCVKTGNIAGKWMTVYNAIDFSQYHLQKTVAPDAPLMFLGRLDKIKGVHHAINLAKITGDKLIIAGNVSSTADNYIYFKEEIEPQIDGVKIIYTGPLNDADKDRYLGQAKALLFPIEWEEPFGLVMVEAMACGTPVIGFRRGSVPEVIDEESGIVVDDFEAMVGAVAKVSKIDRLACRQKAESRFDVGIIAKQYLDL